MLDLLGHSDVLIRFVGGSSRVGDITVVDKISLFYSSSFLGYTVELVVKAEEAKRVEAVRFSQLCK